jgi:hypothetical protein
MIIIQINKIVKLSIKINITINKITKVYSKLNMNQYVIIKIKKYKYVEIQIYPQNNII